MRHLPGKQWVWDRAIDIAICAAVYTLAWLIVREYQRLQALQALIEGGQ